MDRIRRLLPTNKRVFTFGRVDPDVASRILEKQKHCIAVKTIRFGVDLFGSRRRECSKIIDGRKTQKAIHGWDPPFSVGSLEVEIIIAPRALACSEWHDTFEPVVRKTVQLILADREVNVAPAVAKDRADQIPGDPV